jgi:hypothetical protein
MSDSMMLGGFISSLGNLLKLRPSSSPTSVPSEVLVVTAQNRPGVSVERMVANIVTRMNEIGLPTQAFADGTPNYEVQLVRIMCEEWARTLREDARVTAAVPPGIGLQATGASPAGPVEVAGSTLLPVNAYGILQ